MKLGTLIDPKFQQALLSLMRKEIPAMASFKLKTIQKKLGEELKKFDEVRKEYLEKFAEKDEAGKAIIEKDAYKLSEENQKLFNEAMDELGNLEVDIGSIKVHELGAISISALDLVVLDGLVVQ